MLSGRPPDGSGRAELPVVTCGSGPGRRAVLGGLAALAAAGPVRASAGAPEGPSLGPSGGAARIVSLDFGLTETLITLGAPPLASPDVATWQDWVVEPPLPAGIRDLGADREPNLEILQRLAPDLIVTTPYLGGLDPVLGRIAPVRSYPVYTPPAGDIYTRVIAATRALGADIGRPDRAEALILAAEQQMDRARRTLAGITEPLLVALFLDARSLRIYGQNSLFGGAMRRMGLVNAWQGTENYWGFADVGMAALMPYGQARLVYQEPVSPDIPDLLQQSPLWQSVPFVREGRVQRIPAALMFGMLPAAMRFSRLLEEHLA